MYANICCIASCFAVVFKARGVLYSERMIVSVLSEIVAARISEVSIYSMSNGITLTNVRSHRATHGITCWRRYYTLNLVEQDVLAYELQVDPYHSNENQSLLIRILNPGDAHQQTETLLDHHAVTQIPPWPSSVLQPQEKLELVQFLPLPPQLVSLSLHHEGQDAPVTTCHWNGRVVRTASKGIGERALTVVLHDCLCIVPEGLSSKCGM